MNKTQINILLYAIGAISLIILIVLLKKKVIDWVTATIIAGAIVILIVVWYVIKFYLLNRATLEIKTEGYNQIEILEKIQSYVMHNKFIQPTKSSEEIRFILLNKEMYAVYYCEDEFTPRRYYVLYNLKNKLFSLFNNQMELDKHINILMRQQYVIKQKVIDRNRFTGEEREAEEMIDKDELNELRKIKEQREDLEKLK